MVRLIKKKQTRTANFRLALTASLLLLSAQSTVNAQPAGALSGRVRDQFGAVIVNAAVTVTGENGVQRTTVTDEEGKYAITGLAAGRWLLRVEARGFAHFEQAGVEILTGRRKELDVQLAVGLERQEVTVDENKQLSTDADQNRSALVIREAELEALPEDPEELAAALQALAGVPIGPNGGQILIDGMLNNGEPLPNRSSIREVRINANPFSAENDRLGFGQIQIITRPGTEKLRGAAFLNFNDESLNSRNPFALRRASYQMRNFGGTLGGPIVPRRASFFVSFDQRLTSDNAIVNAVVLNSDLVPEPFIRTVLVPRNQTNLSVRFDVQITPGQTLTTRYNFFRNHTQNAGVGGTFLPERAFSFRLPIHTFQITETAVLSKRVVNEFRLQYIAEDQVNEPVSFRPGVNVFGSFASGGSLIGRSRNPEGRLTIQNTLLWTSGAHTLRVGARFRRTTILDVSPDEFNGSFTFAGGIAPVLDAGGELVRDAQGQTLLTSITGIERYRRTEVFARRGFSPEEIRLRGGGATHLIVGGGDPEATARQLDFGAYFQDDWRLRPNFTLNLGLRTDLQTNIPFNLNLAPRVSFAWGLDGGQDNRPKTVMRGGFGVFFDRFNENQVLIANQLTGQTLVRFVITEPAILNSYPTVPSIEQLRASSPTAPEIFRIADDLRLPYLLQAAIGIERQLPLKTTITASYIGSRTLHALRTRNVNIPIIVRNEAGEVITRGRPNPHAGEILQYESSSRLNQNQLFVTLNTRPSRRVTVFANYTLNKAMGDTESVASFPANSYDLRTEYGRSSFDVRHTFSAGGTLEGPLGLRFNPLVFASSGRPFNITSGTDFNEDSWFTDRPALATDLTRPGLRFTRFGVFDPSPRADQPIIPRNFGAGPGYFVVHLTVTRTIAFGKATALPAATSRPNSGGASESKYRLTLGLRVLNIFNRVNLELPVGNLGSPFFGQSVATSGGFGVASIGNPAAGNRRIETQIRFEF
jgi:Carboxypeptidase regulatory-like domain